MEVGVGVADSEIPSTSSTRVMLDLGTRYTLLKITPVKEGKNEFALDIEAVFSPNSIRAMGWTSSAGTAATGCLPVGLGDMWNNSTAFYAAAHVRAFEETDWEPGLSVQTGFHVKRDERSSNLRLGLEGCVGRAMLGEFALD
jgi:hypothetical protein